MSLKLNRVGEKYTTNEGYGVEIIEYFDKNNCTIKFDNGITLRNKKFSDIKKGSVKNPLHKSILGIGYIGIGIFKPSKNRKNTKKYSDWINLFQRCYGENNPSYKGCSVDERWHNFQNFAKWHKNNYREGFEVDKDILVKGNKVYSPETCCFVPFNINVLFTKNNISRGLYPIGVNYDKRGKKFVAQINKGVGNQIHLGYFNTPEEAFQTYKVAKELWIKEVADKWKDLISERVYEAMYNYQVEITD
jgi:biotin-(acetyl-CoA carboxylase) ligase